MHLTILKSLGFVEFWLILVPLIDNVCFIILWLLCLRVPPLRKGSLRYNLGILVAWKPRKRVCVWIETSSISLPALISTSLHHFKHLGLLCSCRIWKNLYFWVVADDVAVFNIDAQFLGLLWLKLAWLLIIEHFVLACVFLDLMLNCRWILFSTLFRWLMIVWSSSLS